MPLILLLATMPAAPEFRIFSYSLSAATLLKGSCLLGLLGLLLLQGTWVSWLFCWVLLLLAGAGIIKGLLRLLAHRQGAEPPPHKAAPNK